MRRIQCIGNASQPLSLQAVLRTLWTRTRRRSPSSASRNFAEQVLRRARFGLPTNDNPADENVDEDKDQLIHNFASFDV